MTRRWRRAASSSGCCRCARAPARRGRAGGWRDHRWWIARSAAMADPAGRQNRRAPGAAGRWSAFARQPERRAARSAQDMTKPRAKGLRAGRGPLLDPTSRPKILQRNQSTPDGFPERREAQPEIVVNGVKTIMVNEPLRAAPARRIASWAMLDRSARLTRVIAGPRMAKPKSLPVT